VLSERKKNEDSGLNSKNSKKSVRFDHVSSDVSDKKKKEKKSTVAQPKPKFT